MGSQGDAALQKMLVAREDLAGHKNELSKQAISVDIL